MDPKRKEERRAFNDQLRARLKLVAAERNIPESKMKWLGRLRHEDLIGFVREHELNWDWVLGAPPSRHRPRHAFHVVQGGLR